MVDLKRGFSFSFSSTFEDPELYQKLVGEPETATVSFASTVQVELRPVKEPSLLRHPLRWLRWSPFLRDRIATKITLHGAQVSFEDERR